MSVPHPFRFGVMAHRWESHEEWRAKARRIEAQGYSTFLVPDHLAQPFGAIPALLAAAEVTTALRLGTFVLDNDFRHPVVLAKDVATLDLLSGGRVELGLGAGWRKAEYEAAGIAFDPARTRVDRLGEALRLLKGLFSGEPVTFAGEFYTVTGLTGAPPSAQRPHPPLLAGGGGKRVLSTAAREADIVSLIVKARADGSGQDWTSTTDAATTQQLAWIRQAAGDRFDALELNVMVNGLIVTADRARAARQTAARHGLTEDEVRDSPHFLIGSAEQICDDLRQRRDRHGISYVVVPEVFAEALAPVVARLAGT